MTGEDLLRQLTFSSEFGNEVATYDEEGIQFQEIQISFEDTEKLIKWLNEMLHNS